MNELNPDAVKGLVEKLQVQVKKNQEIKPFLDLTGTSVAIPRKSTAEHKKIAEYSKTPWAKKIIASRVNRLEVSGIMDSKGSNSELMLLWKKWKMPQKEKIIYRECLPYAEVLVELRKISPTETTTFVKSPFTTIAFYNPDGFNDGLNAEYPVLVLEQGSEGLYKIWDSTTVSTWEMNKETKELTKVSEELHGADVVPFVRYVAEIDSEGNTTGIIEPIQPVLKRIEKLVYDSGMVNHNNSWNVRFGTGLSSISNEQQLDNETDEEYRARLATMEAGLEAHLGTADILTSDNPDAKFGTLPATNPASFVPVHIDLLKTLASVSNTPSNYITGEMSTLSAEQASNDQELFDADIQGLQHSFGEAHESLFRLHNRMVGGDTSEDYSRVVTWWDRDKGSISAKVDALGKAATMLKVPESMLWEEFPNMSPEKLERWKNAAKEKEAKENASMNALMALGGGSTGASEATVVKDIELEDDEE